MKPFAALVVLAIAALFQGGCAQHAFVPNPSMPKDFTQFSGRPGDGWIPVYRLNDRVVWKNRYEDTIAITHDSRLSLLLGADIVQIFQDGKYVLTSSSGPRRDVEVVVYKGSGSKPLLVVKAKSVDEERKVVFPRK